jgi:hypothetical protein
VLLLNRNYSFQKQKKKQKKIEEIPLTQRVFFFFFFLEIFFFVLVFFSRFEACQECIRKEGVWCSDECPFDQIGAQSRSCQQDIGCSIRSREIARNAEQCSSESRDIQTSTACISVDQAVETAFAVGTACIVASVLVPICIIICVIVIIVVVAQQSNRGGQKGAVIANPHQQQQQQQIQQQQFVMQQGQPQPYVIQQVPVMTVG